MAVDSISATKLVCDQEYLSPSALDGVVSKALDTHDRKRIVHKSLE